MDLIAFPDLGLGPLLPHLILAGLFVLALAFELFRPEHGRSPMIFWAPVGCLVGLLWVVLAPPSVPASACHQMILEDGLSRGAAAIIFLTLALTTTCLTREVRNSGFLSEYLALMLSAGLGMTLMTAANNTLMIFLGLELFSLSLYLLCIFLPEKRSCQESGFKYFILSSLASAILLYGLALLYGSTGTTWLHEMGSRVHSLPLLMIGASLVAVGLAFKISAVPFHVWTPDVYQGAPTCVTAFMSVTTKAAALITAFRIFPLTLDHMPVPVGVHNQFLVLFWAMAVITILLGNLMAIAQTDLKRMLAYSGIAHGGYLMSAIFVGTAGAEKAMVFYLIAYAFMNVGAFTAIAVLEDEGMEVNLASIHGLASRYPAVAGALALCLFGLTGLPLTGGFLAKFQLLGILLRDGFPPLSNYLAVVSIMGSFFGACYYLRVVALAYAQPPASPSGRAQVGHLALSCQSGAMVLALCTAGVLVTGLLAEPIFQWLELFSIAI